MDVLLRESTLHLEETAYTIVSPDMPLSTIFACLNSLHYMTFYANSNGFEKLTSFFAYAALHPEQIIYLPLREHGLTQYLARREGVQAAKDIVLVHHTLQLELHMWHSLLMANHMTPSNESSFSLSEKIYADLKTADFRIFYYKENNNHLYIRESRETLFLVGSSKVFKSIASDCLSLSKTVPEKLFPEDLGVTPDIHESLPKSIRDILFAIEYYDEKLWGK